MLYRNKKTGRVIETYGKITSPNYEEVKAEKPVAAKQPVAPKKTTVRNKK